MQLQLLFCTRSPSKKNSIKIQEWQPLIKNDNARMHKPNPAKFFVSLYFQYLKMFHVYLYLELSRFFLPIAIRKLEKRLFPKFSRENQPVLSDGITSPLIWKLIIEIAIQTS